MSGLEFRARQKFKPPVPGGLIAEIRSQTPSTPQEEYSSILSDAFNKEGVMSPRTKSIYLQHPIIVKRTEKAVRKENRNSSGEDEVG